MRTTVEAGGPGETRIPMCPFRFDARLGQPQIVYANLSLAAANAAMNNDPNDDGQREIRERIASLIRANEKGAKKKEISGEELQRLKAAANRLDRMLKASAEAETEALKKAAGRLDQLLEEIRAGKDITERIKRRRERRDGGQSDGR